MQSQRKDSHGERARGPSRKYDFGFVYAVNAGQLLKTEVRSNANEVVRSDSNTYMTDAQRRSRRAVDRLSTAILSMATILRRTRFALLSRPSSSRITHLHDPVALYRFDDYARPNHGDQDQFGEAL